MKAACVVSLLGAGAGAFAQSSAFDNAVQQAVNDLFNMGGADVALPQGVASSPSGSSFDLGGLLNGLQSYMSDLSSSFDSWLGSDAAMSAPAEAQNFQSASQSMAGVLNELNKVTATPVSSGDFNDFTQSVLCDMVDSLNVVIDTGVADFGFDLLPYTVETFDMSKFMGKWYQVYAGQFVIASAESNMACIASEYKETGDRTFDLKDTWTWVDKDSKAPSSRTGTATETSTAQMRVKYDEEQRCLSHGLWVLGTGPVVDGKYDWAIVSDPFAIAVRVLARDPAKFKDQYESTVLPDFQNTFQGFMHTFVPIEQSNCPDREDKAAAVAAPVPVPVARPASAPTKTVTATVTTTAAPTMVPDVAAVAAAPSANSEAISQTQDSDDDDDMGGWIAFGVTLALLLLLLLALLAYCCVRRRRQQKAAAVVVPAKKSGPGSNDRLLGDGSKTCTYCQGAQCVYGGQQEHTLARKLEAVDYAQVGNAAGADISNAPVAC